MAKTVEKYEKYHRIRADRTQRQTAPDLICLGCAIRHHDFKRTAGCEVDDYAVTPLSEAWIDGRRYRLLHYIGTQKVTCTECNRGMPSIYVSGE